MARRNSIIIRNIYPNWIFIQFNYKNSMTLNPKVDYINHPLNKSPSKTAYSFGHSVRFPGLESRDVKKYSFRAASRIMIKRPMLPILEITGGNRLIKYWEDPDRGQGKALRKRGAGRRAQIGIKKRVLHRRVNEWQFNNLHQGIRVKFKVLGANKGRPRNRKSSDWRRAGRTIRWVLRSIRKENTLYRTMSKLIVKIGRNVKTASFGHMSRERPSGEGSNLGPGYYDVVHKSPGRYVTSENKNMLVYSFPKSPRKGPEDPYSDPNFGPGMYRTFS